MLYNNYGVLFSSNDPGRACDLNDEFSELVESHIVALSFNQMKKVPYMPFGSRVFTFNPLIIAERWLEK